MKLKSFRDLDVKGRTVLLRSDLNSDIVKGRVLKGERIRESLKTIRELRKRGAKVVILAHQGNPGKKNFLSLEQHAKLMGRYVKFVDDIVGKRATEAIRKMKNGDVVLLNNVRLVEDEFKPRKRGNVLIKTLLPLVDIYVNDAFSVSHREHASIVGFAGKVPSGIGLLFEKEILAIDKIKMKGSVFVLGGAKGESDIRLLGKGNRVLACGLFGQTCLAAKGFDFGFQNGFLKKTILTKLSYDGFLKKLKGKLREVETPVDFAVDFKGKRKEFDLDDFPRSERIEDIGGKTIEKYCEIIRNARGVYMKGPAGWAEDKRFGKGTVEILKAAQDCKGFSLVGGGQLSEAIVKSRIRKGKFGHVSLSGGALLSVVAGERLVGLEALGYYASRGIRD
jgi:phosphoglycerate kinase